MTKPIVRCKMSDLPVDQCACCPGATAFSAPRLELPAETATTAPGAAGRRRTGLPVLGGTSEYGAQPDIHDMIDELTRAHGHRERVVRERSGDGEAWSGHHVTEVPALVHQLLGATPGGSKDEAGTGSAKSKPAARIEAVDTLMLIDDEAARWIRRLGEDDPGDQVDPTTRRHIPGSGTIACLQRLHALHASQKTCGRPKPHRDSTGGRPDCCTSHVIEHDVRRWWHQARVISGWDSPSWRPNNTCMVCEQRQSLRINDVQRTAICIECRTVWGPDEIGLLAEHIRAENGECDTLDEPA